ncbi:septum formation inhibitor Maf [Achromobacter denitrificans]|jgi:septum formation protein|uniref:dTTP/UTP pyrophosphatase n=1 Tax=Achromobacter denitrificans TaxID=32002 RepID=A0ABZ3G4U8_ACHDE|nr:nucleoside triphosphate pyrophosphatase [Achromobacter denitrificans]MDX3881535.1 nucleoside triphosphate pyrophosphatase [Achromobacter sp.]ASC62891.1 septum formation inhibitor Maf [Achromobacter denitrificans]MBV2157501.1 Maf-like protein [Achromobacter denitrificans]MDF3940658.1 Maf family protein [Achromobacter denitrificans]OLU00765.1 septum formation inhibitor Maf [Achromobacter denitrificans]
MTDTADLQASPARLYLASASPRRRELLTQIGLAHEVLLVPAPPGEDEPQHPGESAADYVQRTARDKALRGRDWVREHGLPRLPLLAADTTVILAGQVLGKPADRDDAIRILRALSGSAHEVRTAVAVWTGEQLLEAVSITEVRMRELTDDEIGRYCDSGEPYGKAGAYGIQGLAGVFISHIAGSYTGVMGLPVFETAGLLRAAGIQTP